MKPTANLAFFFSVSQIIRSGSTRYIYGIRLNGQTHFLMKSLGQNDEKQLDPIRIDDETLKAIAKTITQIENEYKAPPPLSQINFDIYSALSGLRIS
jgi:hypothetical protein